MLWKSEVADRDGEAVWPSPWGNGRPGWHIECSAMAVHHIGQDLDLHSGGIDLCFPHHENEMAQCNAFFHSGDSNTDSGTASGGTRSKPWGRIWLHSGHLLDGSGEKMSKSLGNTTSIRQLLEQASPAEWM